jgi:hypothetical protein
MKPTRRAALRAAIAAAVVAATIASAAGAASDRSSPIRMSASLASPSSAARGRFYARVAPYGGDRAQLYFNLTYLLTGPFRWPYPGAAHIHLGRPTAPGRVVITLCCGYGFAWSSSFPYRLVNRMPERGAYVELHPTWSGGDTLRGRIVFS